MTQTVTINGLNQLHGVFTDIGQQWDAIDYSPALGQIADQLGVIHQGYFDAESGPDGAPWEPWYFRRPSSPKEHPTLNASGRLKGSLAGGLTGGPEHVADVDSRSLQWGTSVPYSFKHQDGGLFPVESFLVGKRGGKKWPGDLINLPQREHVGLNEQQIGPLVDIIADAVVSEMCK